MVFVDGTIVHLTLAQLASQLHASRSDLEWVVDAYTLSFAAVMLGAGAVTDALGAKRAFVTGLLVFTAASAVCAAAGSMLVLNLARLVQGAGSALLLPSALVLATASAADERARHRLVGWWASAAGVGMAVGPLFGGALVSLADWRAVFAVNVVIGILAVGWSLRAIPAVPAKERHRLDVAGVGAATVLIGGLVFALIEGPVRGWGSPPVLAAAGLAVAGVLGFVVAERSVRAPLLPVGVYSDRGFVTAAVQGALFNFAFYGLLFAMSLMLQQGRGLDALTSGLLFLPLTGLIPVGTMCAAPFAQRVGRRAVLGIGQAALAVTLLAVAWAGTAPALWPLVVALVPTGLSAGLLAPTMISQSIAAVEPALHGAASAAFNTCRQVGAAIGIAIFGPVLGTAQGLASGFVACVVVSAAATAAALVLTSLVRPAPAVKALAA
ncbi:MFS transporter [Pseudonocardia acaciae]|uniref:MFS transporter n=1 Tax=Pseudonocardia acaciae TaxID=551276 RepID=UPI00147011C8